MKRLLLFFCLGLFALGSSANNALIDNYCDEDNPAETADVTFCVDLSCFQGVAAAAVAGTFNGWNFGTDFLSDQGGGLYCSNAINMAAGQQEYRFFFAGEQQEDLDPVEDAACTTTGNNGVARVINVVSGVNQTVTFGWETCAAECEVATTTDIELCVDLSCFPQVDAAAVAGPFNGFNFGANPLTNQGNGIYCATVALEAGEQEFRFFFAQQQQENYGPEDAACTNGNLTSRVITVVEGQMASYTYGWERCDDQCIPPGANVEFCVDVSCFEPSSVNIFGSFNSWNPGANSLSEDGDGIWCTTLFLLPGQIEYKFLVDGVEETFNPGGECTLTSGPFTNRVYNVVDGQDDQLFYGFQNCGEECLQAPAAPGANIELCVDVSCFGNVSTVNVFGGFNNWTPNINFLEDEGSGIWCTEIFFAPGNQEFKFLVNGIEEVFPAFQDICTVTCCGGQFTNRVINVVDGQDDAYSWGFQSCDATCDPTPPGAFIDFCVNTACSGIDASAVSVIGAFNNWNPGANPMTPNGDGTWCTTVFMQPGNQEYKFFANGMEESFSVGDPCTISCCGGQFTNRLLNVVDEQNQSVQFDWEECTYTVPGSVDVWDFNVVSGVVATGNADFEPCEVTGGSVTLEHTTSNGNSPLDDHSFVHTTLCGDGEISFRVANVSSFAYVGLTMRESLSPGAKQASVFNDQSPLLRWETRYFPNSIVQVNSFYKPNPAWMRMVRQGDWIFGYYSQNGYSWSPIHAVYLPMGYCIEVGISVFSYVPGIPGQATVDNINFLQYGNGDFGGNDVDATAFPSFNKAGEGWNLYPNPATQEVSVQWEADVLPTHLSIINQYGQEVRTLLIDAPEAANLQIPVDDLTPGTYWIRANQNEQLIKVLPFVKQ